MISCLKFQQFGGRTQGQDHLVIPDTSNSIKEISWYGLTRMCGDFKLSSLVNTEENCY